MEGLTGPFTDSLSLHGSGRGKLLLFGEHSAVYGEPAVGIPLPYETRLDIELESGSNGSIRYTGMDEKESTLLWQMLNAECAKLYPNAPPLNPKDWYGTAAYESTVPAYGGYGSSAAVCSAVADALLKGRTRQVDEKAALANEGEKLFHGTPSGIDAILSSSQGLTAVYPHAAGAASGIFPSFRPLSGHGFFLVTASVPRKHSTKALIGKLRGLREANPKAVTESISELGALANEAIRILIGKADARTLGELATEAHVLLSQLELSIDETDYILNTGMLSGAAGGKLSGAGGGGACYLICETEEVAQKVRNALVDSFARKPELQGRILPVLEIGEERVYERN